MANRLPIAFERGQAEILGLDIESGERMFFATVTGRVETFGHLVRPASLQLRKTSRFVIHRALVQSIKNYHELASQIQKVLKASVMPATIDLKMRFQARLKQVGNAWVAYCPPLDLYTQSDTKESALSHLSEAILAWFESCIERDVLAQALQEVGFQNTAQSPNQSFDEVEVTVPNCVAAALASIHAPC